MKLRLLLTLILFCTGTIVFASKQWRNRADFSEIGRHRAIGVGIGTKGYIGTGHYNGTGVETYLADWWEYDPATNAWAQKSDYPGNSGNGDLGLNAFAIDTVGYVGCGELDDYVLYKFSPQTNSWTQVSGPPGTPKFHDTKGFAINGIGYFTDRISNGIYAYDPATDTWTQKNNPPFGITFSYSGFAVNGKGYLKWNTNLWEYDPVADSWTQKAAYPGVARKSSIGFSQYGFGYIVCGYGTSHSLLEKEVWQYDPANDLWNQMPDFPGSRRRYSTHIMIGDRAYIGSGTNGTNFNDFWEYNTYGSFEENEFQSDLKIYPIPATEIVHFESENLTTFDVTIASMNGQYTHTISAVNGYASFQKENNSKGNYTYRIQVDGRLIKTGQFSFQ